MKNLVFVFTALLLIASCNLKRDRQKKSIEQAEKKLLKDAKAGKMDTIALAALLKDYDIFVTNFPDDTAGARYLFNAADFYRYLHKPLHSIELYSKLYAQYPTYSKRPHALFLQGFIYENEVGNTHAAKNLYEKFLREYPTHPLAKDVRTTVEQLGKTPEQLIQEFEENARQDSLAQSAK